MSAEGLPTYEQPVLRLIGEGRRTIADCCRGLQRPVSLRDVQMNGARLMIDHGVGVRTSATHVLRRIDEDYVSTD